MMTSIRGRNRQYRGTERLLTLKRTKEKRMNEHAELIETARKLSNQYELQKAQAKQMLTILVDIVEAHDKEPNFAANLKAIRDQLDDLGRRLGVQTVNAELREACRTCHEEIDAVLAPNGLRTQSTLGELPWNRLHATSHLAKRAGDLADKVEGGA